MNGKFHVPITGETLTLLTGIDLPADFRTSVILSAVFSVAPVSWEPVFAGEMKKGLPSRPNGLVI